MHRLQRYRIYARSARRLLTGIVPPLLVARIFLGLSRTATHDIRLRETGLRFRVRGRMDIWAVKETVLDRLYECHGFAVEPGWTVIDIGAGIGEFAVLAARQGAWVIAYEPFPPSCALLRENARHNAVEMEIVEVAVAGESGTVALDVGLPDPVYVRSRAPGDGGAASIEVPALSLGDALERSGTDRVDLLKLDCEGAEYAILGSAGPGVLARVDRIVLEYHEWEGHTRDELVILLEGAGHAVETAPNPTYPGIGYLRARRPPAERPAGGYQSVTEPS